MPKDSWHWIRFIWYHLVDDTENNATNIPCSSLKASLTTPTTTRVNYEKEPEENTVRFAVPIEGSASSSPDSFTFKDFGVPLSYDIHL